MEPGLKRHVDAFLRPLDPNEGLARIAEEITSAASKDPESRQAFEAVGRWRDAQVARLLREELVVENKEQAATLLIGAAYLRALESLRASSGVQRVPEDPTAMLKTAAKFLDRVDEDFVPALLHELRDRATKEPELHRTLAAARDDFSATARRLADEAEKAEPGADDEGTMRAAAITGPGGQPLESCRDHLPTEECILIAVVVVIVSLSSLSQSDAFQAVAALVRPAPRHGAMRWVALPQSLAVSC
jgi:hypothetical protein